MFTFFTNLLITYGYVEHLCLISRIYIRRNEIANDNDFHLIYILLSGRVRKLTRQ